MSPPGDPRRRVLVRKSLLGSQCDSDFEKFSIKRAKPVNDVDIEHLLQRVRNGDSLAAADLHRHYVDRMIRLARSRLAPNLGRRIDPEDVVQSACRSFFRRVVDGRYVASEDEQLWHLLAAITVGKAQKAVRRHHQAKRSVQRESSMGATDSLSRLTPEALAAGPSPHESVILIEETERMMAHLTTQQRQIIQLLLQGHPIADIAKEVVCSQRTVQRALERARSHLEAAIDADA